MLTIVDAESVVSIEVFDESAVEENVGIDGVVGLVCDVACKLCNAGSEVGAGVVIGIMGLALLRF